MGNEGNSSKDNTLHCLTSYITRNNNTAKSNGDVNMQVSELDRVKYKGIPRERGREGERGRRQKRR